MAGMRSRGPVAAALTLLLAACGSPGDDLDDGEDAVTLDAAVPEAEVGPSEDLGSALGLGGVAAYRGADADADGRLTADEFNRWFDESGSYGGWDTDGDGRLTRDEFHRSAFSYWDTDSDGRLSETEWRQGTDTWLDENQVGTWEDWDADSDGFVSASEYNRELTEHNLYDTWDRNLDDNVDPDDLRYSLFGMLDRNADNQLDEEEWSAATEPRR